MCSLRQLENDFVWLFIWGTCDYQTPLPLVGFTRILPNGKKGFLLIGMLGSFIVWIGTFGTETCPVRDGPTFTFDS